MIAPNNEYLLHIMHAMHLLTHGHPYIDHGISRAKTTCKNIVSLPKHTAKNGESNTII